MRTALAMADPDDWEATVTAYRSSYRRHIVTVAMTTREPLAQVPRMMKAVQK